MTAKIIVLVQRPVKVVTQVARNVAPVPCCDQDEVVITERLPVLVPIVERSKTQVGIPGIQGPEGPQGPPGEGAPAYIVTAGVPIGAHRVVAVADDLAYYPDLTNSQDVENVIGISVNAAAAGAEVTVVSVGEFVEPLWTWTPGVLFCAVLDGILTQTPPATGAVFEVARALTPTRVAVGLKTPTLRD